MKILSAIRTTVRQFLRDEFESAEDYDFPDDEIDLHIADCLVEISERRPYEVKETLTTTATSKELDISSIVDLLEVDKIEFRTAQDPPDYRNCEVFGSILTMDINFKPLADENVYLYCHKVHQLTEDTSTLAKVALAWINQVRAQVKEALDRITDVNASIGTMSARITQAIDDLTTGRPFINKISHGGRPERDYVGYAARELGNASGYLSQSQGYLRELTSRLSISGVINSYQVWANNKLALYRQDLRRLARARTYTEYPKS